MNICVLAGSLQEFSYWVSDNTKLLTKLVEDHGAAIFGNDVETIMGHQFFEVHVTGTFWERPDANALYWSVKQRLRAGT